MDNVHREALLLYKANIAAGYTVNPRFLCLVWMVALTRADPHTRSAAESVTAYTDYKSLCRKLRWWKVKHKESDNFRKFAR